MRCAIDEITLKSLYLHSLNALSSYLRRSPFCVLRFSLRSCCACFCFSLKTEKGAKFEYGRYSALKCNKLPVLLVLFLFVHSILSSFLPSLLVSLENDVDVCVFLHTLERLSLILASRSFVVIFAALKVWVCNLNK